MTIQDRSKLAPINGNPAGLLTRRQLFTFTFLLVFVVLLVQLILLLRPFFSPILWALVLSTATYPLYYPLWKSLGGRSNMAAGLMTIAVLFAAVLPTVYGIILAGHQGLEAYNQATAWFHAGGLQKLSNTWGRLPGLGRISQELVGQAIVAGSDQIRASLLEGGKLVSTFLISQSLDLATNALMLVTDFFVMLFTLFFMFREGEYAYQSLFRALPLEEDHKAKIFERLGSTLNAVVRGTLLTAFAQGVVAGVAYYLLGLPFATFLGVLSGILSFLPVGGTALVWAPLALYLLLSGAIVKGIILIGIGVGLVGLMDNFLQPILVGRNARLPVLPLFFASLGGLAYFGFLGLFIGPILLAVVLETFTIYQEEYQHPEHDLILSSVPPQSIPNEPTMRRDA